MPERAISALRQRLIEDMGTADLAPRLSTTQRSSAAEPRRWAGMSNALRSARTYASPTVPAATGIARSAGPRPPRSGWPTAGRGIPF